MLRCFNGTRSLGIRLLADTPQTLQCFFDVDRASNLDDRTSTGAFLIFLGANPISWSSIKQRTIARSSTETEYHAIASAAAKLKWVKSLLLELLVPMQSLPTMFSENLYAIYLYTNLVFRSHMKHLVIDYHFVCDLVQLFELHVVHVSAGDQLVDALTKSLSRPRLLSLCNKIDVISGTPS